MVNLQDLTNRSEVGAIKPWGKATAPVGYVLCDGTAISRTTYADLFAVISTTYGAGDSSTTFNVPNLQGKTPQGYDGNTYNLAATGGANTVTVAVTNNQAATNTVTNNQSVTVTGAIDTTSLTTAQIASHSHTYQKHAVGGTLRSATGNPNRFGDSTSGAAGSGTGHTHSHTLSGTMAGTVAVTTALTGAVTASGTNAFSPYVVVNYIIKH